jgi:hypothetical protein
MLPSGWGWVTSKTLGGSVPDRCDHSNDRLSAPSRSSRTPLIPPFAAGDFLSVMPSTCSIAPISRSSVSGMVYA